MRVKYFNHFFTVFYIAGMSILFHSCYKDEIDLSKVSQRIEITPGLAIPVGYGSLSINDLLQRFDSSGFIKEDSASGILEIVYNDHLISYKASDIIKVPDQKFDQFFVRNEIGLPQIIDSVEISKSKNYGFTMNQNEQIDSIVMNHGILRYDISSSFLNTGFLEVSSPQLIKSGKPYFQRMQVGNTTGNYHQVIDYDLSDASLHFSRTNDSSFVPLFFRLVLLNSNNPLRNGDSVLVNISFLNLDFHILYGDIGYKSLLHYMGEISMNLFQNPLGGTIEFEAPTFNIDIKNSFGVPILINLSDVSTVSDRTGQNVDITFPPSENPVLISYPSLSERGQSKETVVPFDNISPAISTVINTEPSKMKFTADAYTDTTLQGSENFIIDTSKFIADLNVNLPLWLRAGDFAMEDTMDFDLKNILSDPGILDTLDIKLNVSNGLPIDLSIQMDVVDSNYVLLESLFDPAVLPQIKSGVLDQNFRVNQETGKTKKETFASLGQVKIKQIENAKHIIVRAAFTTTNFNSDPALKVKLYPDYKLDFDLAIRARLRVKSN